MNKGKITPFDTETALMVESITKKDCVLEAQDEWFRLEADLEDLTNKEASAVIEAIKGRFGERIMQTQTTYFGQNITKVSADITYAEKSGEQAEEIGGDYVVETPRDLSVGKVYKSKEQLFAALQVDRSKINDLIRFTSGGRMEIEKKLGSTAKYHFLDENGIMQTAKEGDYICAWGERTLIVKKEYFELYFTLA